MDLNMLHNLSFQGIKKSQSSIRNPPNEDSIHLKSYMNMASLKGIFTDSLLLMQVCEKKFLFL